MIGTDPELFLVRDGEVVPPIELIQQDFYLVEDTEKHPVFWEDNNGSKIFMDGAAFEFILPPSDQPKILYRDFCRTLEALNDIAEDYFCEICHLPTANFNARKWIQNGTPREIQATIFGCDPDEDAFSESYKCKTLNVKKYPYRHGGGHIHIELGEGNLDLDNPDPRKDLSYVRYCSVILGNLALTLSDYPELEKLRSQFYGPGRYRWQNYSKTYGLEYRSPSNQWLTSEEKIEKMFLGVEKVFEFHKKQVDCREFFNPTVKAIINGDKGLSKVILGELSNGRL